MYTLNHKPETRNLQPETLNPILKRKCEPHPCRVCGLGNQRVLGFRVVGFRAAGCSWVSGSFLGCSRRYNSKNNHRSNNRNNITSTNNDHDSDNNNKNSNSARGSDFLVTRLRRRTSTGFFVQVAGFRAYLNPKSM